MKKLSLICLLIISSIRGYGQQSAQFSQYLFNGIYINPAYAGYKEQVYLQSSYRSQWTGVEGAPKTASVAVDGITDYTANVGLALLVQQDRIGAQGQLSMYGNYAYRLRMGRDDESRLALGIGLGVLQLGLDGQKLNPIDAQDEYIPAGKESSILPDARAGVFYSNRRFFAGFSADHLVAHLMGADKNSQVLTPVPKPHYYLTGGALFQVNPTLKFKPTFLLKDDLAGPSSLDLNVFFLFKEQLWIGGFYRSSVKMFNKDYLQKSLHKSSAVGLVAEVFASKNLRIDYSYDYSLNKMGNYNFGSHEISIGLLLGQSRGDVPRCYF